MSEYIKLDFVSLAKMGMLIVNTNHDKVCKAIESLHAAAIEIVHCSDCKYSNVYALDSNENPQRWCKVGLAKAVNDNDFCSWGER